MNWKLAVRRLVDGIDRRVLGMLPPRAQLALKRPLLSGLRFIFPQFIPAWVPDELLVRRPPISFPREPLPEWLAPELTSMAREFDAGLSPSVLFRRGFSTYHPPVDRAYAGEVYFDILRAVRGPVDAVIVVPWLKPGGADRWAIALARALAVDRAQRVLVLATEPSNSPWSDRLPQGAQFLEIGSFLASLHFDRDDSVEVLSRLLVQLAPRVVHVVGSKHGWSAIRKHGRSIRAGSRIYASLFCDELDETGVPTGYAESHLLDCSPWLDGVLVDNRRAPVVWQRRHGISASLFSVVEFPAPASVTPLIRHPLGQRVLWAGRFDRQKRLDLVAEIAKLTPELHWDVHGSSVVPGHGSSLVALSRLPNVTLHGQFDSFAELLTGAHGVFVYTSAWDGMPTILLDAAQSQLPIVASSIGGVSDFLDSDVLVDVSEGAAGFANLIRLVLSNPSLAAELLRAQNRALERRTWDSFSGSIPG